MLNQVQNIFKLFRGIVRLSEFASEPLRVAYDRSSVEMLFHLFVPISIQDDTEHDHMIQTMILGKITRCQVRYSTRQISLQTKINFVITYFMSINLIK